MEIDMLPEQFLKRMRRMLGEEYTDFLESYEKPQYRALRINYLKADETAFLTNSPFSLRPVPWATGGFYYTDADAPGKHPYHEAGVYYIQEPSAMAPVEFLMQGSCSQEMAEERILDLCAAPGGKSTQIAAQMRGSGILVSNEVNPARAKILSANIERMGIRNALVTNESPKRLAEVFPGFFTRILVDAPCSGEGMFRKNETAVNEWSPKNVALCADRQEKIMDQAAGMLAAGGRLVYSTCTFSQEENEGMVRRFLKNHPEMFLVEAKKTDGMRGGIDLEETVRLWPHCIEGEGHYMAVMKKAGEIGTSYRMSKKRSESGIPEWENFAAEYIKKIPEGEYLKFGDQLYLAPFGMPSIANLKVLRPGLHLGTVKKKRLEPSHALAMALRPGEAVYTANFPSDVSGDSNTAAGNEIRAYLEGQTFAYTGEQGWYLIAVDGFSIGWGKLAAGRMKNHYPKGLRK